MPDTVKSDSCGKDIAFDNDSIFNNSPNNLVIDVVRVQNVTTPNWLSAFCLDVCYLPSKDSVRFTLLPNERQIFIFHFYTDASTAASGTATMKFKNVSSPSNTLYQTFYGSTVCASGINETVYNSGTVSIYPNPFSTEATIQVSSIKYQASGLEFKLYDVFGRKVINFKPETATFKLDGSDLPAGIYSYNLVSGNEKIASGKIVVSK